MAKSDAPCMASLYADENFPFQVVVELRNLGHDVRTAQEAGHANQGLDDDVVLRHAMSDQRAVLTHNRRHFIRLHKRSADHFGIVVCTEDHDFVALARRIHQAVSVETALEKKLLRINKPS